MLLLKSLLVGIGLLNGGQLGDSCRLRKVEITVPAVMEIFYYKSFFDKFCSNNTSDYQLICISQPDDDSNGHLMYLNIEGQKCISFVGTSIEIKERRFDTAQTNSFVHRLKCKIEHGGYYFFCDKPIGRIMYSVCIVKKKQKVIFRYQGVNRNIMSLEGADANEVKNVIRLVRKLGAG